MKYQEIIVPLIEDANIKTFKVANILRIIGIVTLLFTIFLLDFNTIRLILVSFGLLFISLPFTLNFFIDSYKVIGIIKFTENEIVTKLKKQEPKFFDIKKTSNLDYKIVDFEGETKLRDFVNSASQLNLRSGTDNSISYNYEKKKYHFKFKLTNGLNKKKVIYFLENY